MGNFVEADILNDDTNITATPSLEIEPSLPTSLQFLLEYIYFAQSFEGASLSLQELINHLVMAQKYDEQNLMIAIEDTLSAKCELEEIYNLYQVATNLFATNLIGKLEQRIETLYTKPKFDFAKAESVIKELIAIGATHLVRKVEEKAFQEIQGQFPPFSEIVYSNDTSTPIKVQQVIKRQIYQVLNDEEFIEDDSDSERFAMLNTSKVEELQVLRIHCPFCNQTACNSSSMFSHFALFCPQYEKPRLKLIEFTRDRIQNALKDNIAYISNERLSNYEPWFLPCTIDISELKSISYKPLPNPSVFKTMEKELGILGYLPKDYSKELGKYFKIDLLYQKQIERIQKYVVSVFLPTLFSSIEKDLSSVTQGQRG